MSSNLGRTVPGVIAGLLAAGLIAALSAVSLPLRHGGAARIRLSWSARPERIETCRALSQEEMAAQLEHMRREVECEGKFATYDLMVTVDDQVVEQTIITGGGLRNDRPIHYLHDFDVAAGERSFHLSLVRRETPEDRDESAVSRLREHDDGDDDGEDDDDEVSEDRRPFEAGRSQRERIERRRREQTALPPSLELDTTLVIASGKVAIVSFDPSKRTFGFISRQASAR